jgi:ATP-dependent exoDNAse (exonuclease V) beta subunit
VAVWQGRIVGASPEEIDAAAEAAHRALAHPLLVRSAAAARTGRCRRETPVTIRLEDGALVEGVVDAAFVEDGIWTVVDFKTDVEMAGRILEYRRQVGLYRRAIASATGMPVRAVLLRV